LAKQFTAKNAAKNTQQISFEPRPNTLVVCPNCGHKYFPFGKSVDELEEPPDLGI
jgi:hypothetical protein